MSHTRKQLEKELNEKEQLYTNESSQINKNHKLRLDKMIDDVVSGKTHYDSWREALQLICIPLDLGDFIENLAKNSKGQLRSSTL